jgi:hypothetical protein
MLRRNDPRSVRTKFLVPIAVAGLPAGYLSFGESGRRVKLAAAVIAHARAVAMPSSGQPSTLTACS